jgi:hypothetical protein
VDDEPWLVKTQAVAKNCYFVDTNNFLTSTLSTLAISNKVSTEGCISLVHHLENVVSAFPNSFANFPVGNILFCEYCFDSIKIAFWHFLMASTQYKTPFL